MITLTLPWPPKELSPNARLHWRVVAKAKKAYRAACGWTAKEQGARRIEVAALNVKATFFPPDRRAYDQDNLIARMKAGFDGVADVLGVDDKHWSLSIARAGEIGGFVRVEVSHA